MTGIELIAQERKEQIEKHYHTTEADQRYFSEKQLAEAAATLAMSGRGESITIPDNWNVKQFQYMVSKSYKERLIIAGALIAAEIDRLQIEAV
jgi:predicted metal-dependent phosphotriesterase family hydrolase